MKRHTFRPATVESLETLALLSAGMGHLSGVLAPAHQVSHPFQRHTPQPAQFHLNGTVAGSFVAFQAATGPQINLAAAGFVAPLGQSFALGQATETFAPASQPGADAYVVLTNGQGSVTIALHASLPRAGTLIPSQFSYVVAGGTGAYTNVTDHGTARLNYHVSSYPSATIPIEQGTFNVRFIPARGR